MDRCNVFRRHFQLVASTPVTHQHLTLTIAFHSWDNVTSHTTGTNKFSLTHTLQNHLAAFIFMINSKCTPLRTILKWKNAQRRRKHCALAVVRRTHRQTYRQRCCACGAIMDISCTRGAYWVWTMHRLLRRSWILLNCPYPLLRDDYNTLRSLARSVNSF